MFYFTALVLLHSSIFFSPNGDYTKLVEYQRSLLCVFDLLMSGNTICMVFLFHSHRGKKMLYAILIPT